LTLNPAHPPHVLAVPSASPEWRIGWLQQNEAMGIPAALRPEARWVEDPIDYTRAWVYSPDDARWRDPGKQSAVRELCGGDPRDDDHGRDDD
jgi:hypothetical protein